jgi:hypothetical protein
MVAFLVLIGISVALLVWRDSAKTAARRRKLVTRLGDDVAVLIMRGQFWQGQTAEMLIEARGRPHDIDERVLKKATRHVFKYKPTGRNRYALRITLEDGEVVGWDDKR